MRTLPETFTLLLSVLRNIIAPVAAKDRARTDFLVYVYGRITRIGRRFQRLYTRWKSGSLPKPRLRTPRAVALARPTHLKTGMPIVPLPTRPMWLIREIQLTAASRSQLQHWLTNTPELTEFIAAAPQAGRLLRPLCHMLGVPLPPFLAKPKPEPKPRPDSAPALPKAPKPPRLTRRDIERYTPSIPTWPPRSRFSSA